MDTGSHVSQIILEFVIVKENLNSSLLLEYQTYKNIEHDFLLIEWLGLQA